MAETIIDTLRPDGTAVNVGWTAVGDSPLHACVDETSSDGDSTYMRFEATGVTETGPEDPQVATAELVAPSFVTSAKPLRFQVRDGGVWKKLVGGAGLGGGGTRVRNSESWARIKTLSVRDGGAWKVTLPMLRLTALAKRVVVSGDGSTRLRISLYDNGVSPAILLAQGGYFDLFTTYEPISLDVFFWQWLEAAPTNLETDSLRLKLEGEITPDNSSATLQVRVTQAYVEAFGLT